MAGQKHKTNSKIENRDNLVATFQVLAGHRPLNAISY